MAIAKQRSVKIKIESSTRDLDRELMRTKRKLRKFAKESGKVMRTAGGVLAGGLALGATALGGVALGEAAGEALSFERAFTRLQIASDATDGSMAGFRDTVSRVSTASGIARQELLAGAASYVALTGDAAGARASMELFAKVANATGATMADIATTAASMRDNMKIDPKDFEAAFSAMAVQGKAGAIELRELAQELAGIAPSFAAFKGASGLDGLRQLGAAVQVVRKGFGSASESVTGLRALITSLQRNSRKLGQSGVKVFARDAKTGRMHMRAFADIIDDIGRSRLAKDSSLLIDALGSDEAKRAYDQLSINRRLLDGLIAQSSDAQAINRDAAKFQASAAGRIENAWNAARMALADAFKPEVIERIVPAIEKVSSAMARLVGYVDGFFTPWQEIMEMQDELEKRDAGIAQTQKIRAAAGLPADKESATRQFDMERAQLKVLRQGGFADRSSADLIENRARVAAGPFLRRDEFLAVLDKHIGATIGRELSSVVGPLANIGRIKSAVPGLGNINIKIGSDTVAKASANAPGHRTRAGGL